MSKGSKRRHRQQEHRNHAPPLGHPAASAQNSPGRTKRPALLIGAAIVVGATILYAVSGGGRQTESADASVKNAGSSNPSAPAPSLFSGTAGAAPAVGVSGPKIVFATPVHDFGQIKGGEAVKYTYVFTNVGGAMLQVSNVQASCGCTTAGEWTRQVEPGKTGSIPIQFNSGGFSGQVGKSITVTCNDPNQPTLVLQIKGTIWKPIDVTPQFAVMHANAENVADAKVTVRIVNNEEQPLTLSEPESSNPLFAAELKAKQPGKEIELLIKGVPQTNMSNLQGQITMKTSSSNAPALTVTAMIVMQPVLNVTPPQINLPAERLTNSLSSSVSIRYSGTMVMTLSDPAVSAKGVDVQLKENEPGRLFTLTLTFPAGFEIAGGQKAEVTVKSNHPQFPIIRVPIIQPPRPAPPVVPPGIPAVPPSLSQEPPSK